MKKLDSYIIKKFLGTFVYSIGLIIVIVIVFDLSEKMDDFLDKEAPLSAIIFDYYFNFIPYFINLFGALFIFIAVIFFTSKMAEDSEIIAILSSGVSFKRFLFPYFISSFVIALFSFILIEWVIPPANKVRLDFEEKYIKCAYRNRDKNIHRQIEKGVFVYMESYNNFYDIGYKFSMEKFENNQLKSKLVSDYVQWDTITNKWKIHNYFIRELDGMKEKIVSGRVIDSTINMYPKDFTQRLNVVETMNMQELNSFISEQKMIGSENISTFLIEKYKRFAYPFSTFILALIGVSLSSRKTRGGVGINIGLGLLIAFSYILFMQIFTVFATNSNMNPLISVWVPNIIYAIIAFYFYRKASK
ncbi:MAG: LptF/LptG family permease [Bacteroidetes bacterium]|nr:LptF/LptG family permease [Bacteroidota bacterium]